MDGVIVDTEPVHHFAYYQHFKELNIEVSDELYRSFTGNSTRNILDKGVLEFLTNTYFIYTMKMKFIILLDAL